jgi:hypothetical protein
MGYIILTLLQDNPCNTTIVDEVDNVLYTVATEFADVNKPITRVKSEDDELIAEWEWRSGLRSDLLAYGNRARVSASSWLKKSIIPFNE